MNAVSLLTKLREHGVDLHVDGDRLRYRAPKGVLSQSLMTDLADQKQELLAILRNENIRTATETSASPETSKNPDAMDRMARPPRDVGSKTSSILAEHPFASYVEPIKTELWDRVGLLKRFESAQGCYLQDEEGRRYLDAIAQYGAVPFGHNPEDIWDAIAQLRRQQRPCLATGSLMDEAGALGERLLAVAGHDLSHVAFSNSGAESTEVAIKICRAATGRTGILSTRGGFHGLTLGALAVTGANEFQDGFGVASDDFQHVPYGDIDAIRTTLQRDPEKYAALIVEPIQGEAGIVEATADYLRVAGELCDSFGSLLIVDEVQTGLGRTGQMFAFHGQGVKPDVVTVAKALGGGLVPIGAVLCNDRAYSRRFGLRHSSTFAGNTLACRAGMASLMVLERNDRALIHDVADNGAYLKRRLQALQSQYPDTIQAVTGRGYMLGVRLNLARFHSTPGLLGILAQQEMLIHLVVSYLLNVEHVRLSPSVTGHDVLRIEPPLTATQNDCDILCEALDRAMAVLDAENVGPLVATMLGFTSDEIKSLIEANSKRGGFGMRGGFGEAPPNALPSDHPFSSKLGESDPPAGSLNQDGHLKNGRASGGSLGDAPPNPPRFLSADRTDIASANNRTGIASATFGFIVHLSDIQDLQRFDSDLGCFNREQLTRLKAKLADYVDPFPIGQSTVTTGDQVTIRGNFVLIPYTPQELVEMPSDTALELVQRAVEVAAEQEVQVIGLGGFSSILSQGGATLKYEHLPPITSGNTYTVSATHQAVLKTCHQRGVSLPDSTVAVVGASGQIGKACALRLADTAKRLVLIGSDHDQDRTRRRLRGVATSVVSHLISQSTSRSAPEGTLAAEIFSLVGQPGRTHDSAIVEALIEAEYLQVDGDVERDLKEADVIITATSDVEGFIHSQHLKTGAIVCDVSRPSNVHESVWRDRDDVLVIEGGHVRVPGNPNFDVFAGVADNVTLACVAETMLWTVADGRQPPDPMLGITQGNVAVLEQLGRKHGFEIVIPS